MAFNLIMSSRICPHFNFGPRPIISGPIFIQGSYRLLPARVVDEDRPEADLDGVGRGGVDADVGGDPRDVAVGDAVTPQMLLQLRVTHLKGKG